jgi:hypothetical protein
MYECVAKRPVNEARASGFLRVYGKFVIIIIKIQWCLNQCMSVLLRCQ